MTRSKSSRRNSSSSPTPSSNKSANGNIEAASAALQAATLTSHDIKPSVAPQPSKQDAKPKALGVLSDVKDVVQLTAKEFGKVAENKQFTPLESLAEHETAASGPAGGDDKTQSSQTFTGSSSGSPRDSAAGEKTGVLAPSALSYLSSNLFDSLGFDRKDNNINDNSSKDGDNVVDNGGESDNSESSEDSELDYSSSSSESSISNHSTEDEESEEEEETGEETEEEDVNDDEAKVIHSIVSAETNTNGNGYKAVRKKSKQQRQRQRKQQQLVAAGSPLLIKTLQHEQQKHMQHLQQQGLQPQRSPTTKSASGSPKSPTHPSHHHHHQEKESVVLLVDQSAQTKWANWSVRTLWTLIMIGGFFACVAAGPLFVILLVVMVQGLVYKEVIYLANVPSREKRLPWFRAMNWYFLFSTNYFFYGESLIHYFQHVVFKDAFLLPLATHHRFISFTLYVIGFVFFVANLKKGHYRFQFSQFAWTHMTLLLVVCQSHFIINNIFEGLIWFFLPVSLVIANDIWAYIFGFFFGKTPLIKLSPKKTVEGFVGGWIMTIVFGMMFATLFLRYPYMICPVKDLRATAFSDLTCDPNPVFVPIKYYLKPWMVALVRHLGMRDHYVMIAPLQLHSVFMACFASLIAPFGGFFASGFKRAFKIKDFGQSIPGHGGITDRMDCQFLMGLFSYMYYQSFIKTSALSVGVVLQSAINNLQGQEQMELFDHMRQYLIGQGLLDEESCVIIPPKEPWVL